MHLEGHIVGRQKAILVGFSTVPQENELRPFTSTPILSHNSHRSYQLMPNDLNGSKRVLFFKDRGL